MTRDAIKAISRRLAAMEATRRVAPVFRIVYRPADMDDQAFAAKLATETADLGPEDIALIVRFILPPCMTGDDDAATYTGQSPRH